MSSSLSQVKVSDDDNDDDDDDDDGVGGDDGMSPPPCCCWYRGLVLSRQGNRVDVRVDVTGGRRRRMSIDLDDSDVITYKGNHIRYC